MTYLRNAGLKMNPKKCEIMKDSIKYLGRIVDASGIYPDPQQAESIRTWMEPRNRTEVQSFLGLSNYYREFIRDYAAKAKPLTDLTRSTRKFEWSAEA